MTDQTKPLLPDMPDEIWLMPSVTPGYVIRALPANNATRYVRADRPVSGDMKAPPHDFATVGEWYGQRVDHDSGEIVYELHNAPRDSMIVFHGPNAKTDREMVLASLSRIEAAQSSGVGEWQPIETVDPDYNEYFMVANDEGAVGMGMWSAPSHVEGRYLHTAWPSVARITKWMPLPAAPKADTKTGDE